MPTACAGSMLMSGNGAGLAAPHATAPGGNAGSGTVLAFDFGEKFTGVAVGESSVRVAHPLGLITAQGSAARMKAAAELVAEWKPRALVVGLPLSLDGAEHELTRRC